MGNTSSQYSASDLFTMCMGPRWKVALDESKLKTATWNIAAVNNNPFEYWVTHEDAAYNTLMQGVESFIDQPGACRHALLRSRVRAGFRARARAASTNQVRGPALVPAPTARAQPHPPRPTATGRRAGERDVPVSEVFTPAMWAELKALMTTQGWDVAATEQLWASDFAGRKIISGFMKDKELGEKRLASMPDRVTNTINTLGDAGKVHRPTVISCYDGDMSSMAAWWKEWRAFEP